MMCLENLLKNQKKKLIHYNLENHFQYMYSSFSYLQNILYFIKPERKYLLRYVELGKLVFSYERSDTQK